MMGRFSRGRIAALLLLPVWSAGALAAEAAAQPHYVPIPEGRLISVLSGGGSVTEPVRIAPFSMRATPVTNQEFLAFITRHPEWQRGQAPAIFADASYLSQSDSQNPAKAAQAVVSVSWFAAQAFCDSEGARLPTWYEWEYVAAADDKRADARRDPAWRAKILSWYAQSSNQSQPPVGGAANFYGVRNMHGLIWEWVDDFNALMVSADSRNQGDPDQLQYCGAGAISLQDRDNYAVLMRIALLSSLGGADTTSTLGFRCAKTVSMESK